MVKQNDKDNGTMGPNAPCSCGSGLKYKKCCALKSETGKGSSRFFLRTVVIAGGLIFVFAVVYGNIAPPPQSTRSVPRLPVNSTGGSTPAPWHYDAANNRHWHPGHGHWHDGQPPPASQRNAANPATTGAGQTSHTVAGNDLPGGETPDPWHYDVANDRHWHPEHNHWHGGPPPANR